LAAGDAARLREAAAALAASATAELDHDEGAAARTATAGLNWAAFMIDANPFHSLLTGRVSP